MNILILGGTGAMGTHLVNLLAKSPGNSVTVTSRKKRTDKENVHYLQGDAHDPSFLPTLLGKKYDAIVDFMVYRTPEFHDRYKQLLSACGQYVYMSSSRVYAPSEKPLTEESPRLLDVSSDKEYLATDEYALTKARQEDMLFAAEEKKWTIIRPYITYSEIRLQLGVLEKEGWLYRACHGRSIVFSHDIARHVTTLTYGLDVARGMAALIGQEKAKGEVFHITAPKSIRWSEVETIYLDTMERTTGHRPDVRMTEWSLNLGHKIGKYQVMYDRLFDRVFDNGKIGRFIDTRTFVSPQEGLPLCLERFLRHPAFGQCNIMREAMADRIAGERMRLNEIDSLKHKIKYLLYRYIF